MAYEACLLTAVTFAISIPYEASSDASFGSIAEIIGKGKIPIICGGTGFYINSIIYDYSYGKGGANLEVREKFMKIIDSERNANVN